MIGADHFQKAPEEIRDKARALEAYARQAQNTDAERKACEIRLRAERRTGELLRDLPRSEVRGGGDRRSESARDQTSSAATNDPPSPYAETLERTGLSRQTAHRYQQLADVSAERFESALADPYRVVSTAQILRDAGQEPPGTRKSCLGLLLEQHVIQMEGAARNLYPIVRYRFLPLRTRKHCVVSAAQILRDAVKSKSPTASLPQGSRSVHRHAVEASTAPTAADVSDSFGSSGRTDHQYARLTQFGVTRRRRQIPASTDVPQSGLR